MKQLDNEQQGCLGCVCGLLILFTAPVWTLGLRWLMEWWFYQIALVLVTTGLARP